MRQAELGSSPVFGTSGFWAGFVQFRSPDDAAAALQRSNQVLGSRYVEVFRCSRSEMEQARMHAMQVLPKQWHPHGQQMPAMAHMDQGYGGGKGGGSDGGGGEGGGEGEGSDGEE